MRNITFHSISIRNFLSYGNVPTTITLDKTGTTLIIGENLDNSSNGKTSNGSGKTVIINALVYALYNKTISKIQMDNLINDINKKNLEVSLSFSVNDTKYQVIRTRKNKEVITKNIKSNDDNSVYIFRTLPGENEEDITPDSISSADQVLLDIIRIPFDSFTRMVAISASGTPFFDLPSRSTTQANQTDFIEELFDYKTLSEKAASIKDMMQDIDKNIALHQVKIDAIEDEKRRHTQMIEGARKKLNDWDITRDQNVASIQAKVEKLQGVNFTQQKKLLNAKDLLTEELTTTKKDEKVISQSIDTLEESITSSSESLKALENNTCPYCNQHFADATQKIKHEESIIAKCKKDLIQLTNAQDELNDIKQQLQEQLEKITPKLKYQTIAALMTDENLVSSSEEKIATLKEQENPYVNSIENLTNVSKTEYDFTTINSLKIDADHHKFLHKLLTKKDSFIRKALLNKNIPFLNSRLSLYSSSLGLPHCVEFTQEMAPKITKFGRSLDFGNLSAGQKARVNFALSLAFRDVLQSIHGKINICMLDEVLDIGLDSTGIQHAISLVKQCADNEKSAYYVISHRDEVQNMFSNFLFVQLKGGFSSVTDSR